MPKFDERPDRMMLMTKREKIGFVLTQALQWCAEDAVCDVVNLRYKRL